MSNYVRYNSTTGRTPSVKIFGDMEHLRHDNIMGKCLFHFDDFAIPTNHASISASGGYYTIQENSGTITGKLTVQDIGIECGVLQINTLTTDNSENHIQLSGYGLPVRLGNTSGNTGDAGFEVRLACNTVTDGRLTFMVGFGGPIIAAGHIADAGTFVATGSFVGFQVNEDDGDGIDTTYQAISQTQQVLLANAATLVADTYINLGFRYRSGDPDARKGRFYVNGVESNTYITTALIDAATFPEDEAMGLWILTKQATTTANVLSVDWAGWYQYVDG